MRDPAVRANDDDELKHRAGPLDHERIDFLQRPRVPYGDDPRV